jgi:hypothetical protein
VVITEKLQRLDGEFKEADVALYRAKELGAEPGGTCAKPSGLSEIRASKMPQHPVSAV